MTDRAKSQAELEQTVRDFADGEYAEALEHTSEGLGWDTVAAAAATHARTSRAIATNGQAFYVLPHSQQTGPSASGPVRASGAVLVGRGGSAQAQLRIPAGKALLGRLRGSSANPAPALQPFELQEEVVLLPGELGPVQVLARATRPGDQGNLPAGTLVGFLPEGRRVVSCWTSGDGQLWDSGVPDVFTAGDVGRYLRLGAALPPRRVLTYGQIDGRGVVSIEPDQDDALPAPDTYEAELLEWADLGVTLTQPEAFTNGRHGTLDAIGRESGTERGPGENDLDYAYRISSLPDVVSPNAIERIAARILSPLGVRYQVHEAQLDLVGFVLDHTPLDLAGSCEAGQPYPGQQLLTLAAERRFFLVCVGTDANAGSYGLPLDALNAGVNAYDSAQGPGDGAPQGYVHALRTLYQGLREAHEFGVGFRLLPESVYVPWTERVVDIEVQLPDDGPQYIATATLAIEDLFQLQPRGVVPWEVAQAIEQALVRAGLAATDVLYVSSGSLSAGPREVLRLGALFVLTP